MNITYINIYICLSVLFVSKNIWGHIKTVPTCNSGIYTFELANWNAMPHTGHKLPTHQSKQTPS